MNSDGRAIPFSQQSRSSWGRSGQSRPPGSGLTTHHHERTARQGGRCRPEMATPGTPTGPTDAEGARPTTWPPAPVRGDLWLHREREGRENATHLILGVLRSEEFATIHQTSASSQKSSSALQQQPGKPKTHLNTTRSLHKMQSPRQMSNESTIQKRHKE